MFGSKAGGPPSLGLSINTGAANTFGASATSSQPPAAGGLFGSTSSTQPSTQSTSLFGNTNTTNTSQPAQTTSLFGNQSTQQQQQPQQQQAGGGGMFGSSMATSKPGGLFGGTSTAASNPGGLFGASTAATSQPAQSGGLFGATSTQQPAATTNTGLFGQTLQKPAGSLFGGGGAPANTQTTGATGGLFGQKPAASGGASMFGQSAAAPSKNLFGSFSQTTQQQAPPALGSTMGPQVVPGVRIDLSQIRSTTRFNDLQEDVQNTIARIDAHIQGCIAQKEEVDAFIPAHEAQLDSIPDDVRFVSRKHAAVDSALGADLHAIKALRDQVRADAGEAKLSFGAIENLKLPVQYHQTPSFGASTRQNGGSSTSGDGAAAEDLVNYFSRATDEMDEHVKRLQKTVREIDSHLSGVEQNISEQASRLQASSGSLGGGGQDDRYMELYHVLRDFEEGIVQVATVVGGAREGVTELQMNDFRGRGINSY
ncbi:unnamed protein product [Discula destructiva]